jgi:peptidoglycan L-alanyl-D-glutamate endopeptidase CwlK
VAKTLDAETVLFGLGGALVGYGLYRTWRKRAGLTGPPPPGLRASAPYIAQLHPSVQPRARELLQRAINVGIPLVVTSAYRDPTVQAQLYAQGRTAPGPIVTNAPPGWSWHEYRLAFDVAPMDPTTGRPTWPEDLALWQRIGAAGKAAGLEWGGDWTGIVDRPHFQFTGGAKIEQARAGRLPASLAGPSVTSFRLAQPYRRAA